MNYQEPNLSNVPKSPALPEESSSPQSEAAADPRFVMPSISPFPMNRTVISTATIDSQSSQPQLRQQTQQRQPIIPLPFLSANPQLAQSANINHMNMNRSTNQRNIVRGPMCHNAQQQTQQVQQHRQAHHPSQPGYHPSLYNGMNHQQITHQNRFNNNELCVTNTAQQQHQLQQQQHQHHQQQQQQQQQALRHGSQAQVQQSAQSAAARMSNMGTMNTMNGNNMRLHQLTQNQTRNQPQNANNIANVNHIQNKYNTTIINLNGSLNGNLNGLMDSVVQMNGEVDNQCVVPYPSNGQHHGAQNNINMIRARARSNAAVPMSASLTKRGSIMAGKYKILSVLADGTFSRTVCAQDIKTLRLVAIKIMKDKCQYVGVQEAKRLAFFNSKDAEDLCHVVRFVETIHYQTRFCLVLEILGISLFKYLQINQFATLNVVRKVAIQLMISMQFVHSFNQIHADLKPGIKDTTDGTAAIATTSTEDTKQSDEDDEDELYQVLLHKPLVWLYKIPANIWRGRNNKCELWNLRQPIWMGRLRIVAYNHGKHLEFQFLEKDGKLFLKSTRIKLNQITTDDDGTNPIHQYFDAYGVIDSSRYFIVWVDVPAHEGKKIPFGFGIRERLDAFDIRAAVADQMKIVRRKDSDILEDSDDSHGTEYKYNKLDVATTENRFELNDDEMISIGHDIDNIDIGHAKQEVKGKKHSTILKVGTVPSITMNDELCLLPPPPSPPLTPKDELSHISNIQHRIHPKYNQNAQYDDDDFGEFQLPNDNEGIDEEVQVQEDANKEN